MGIPWSLAVVLALLLPGASEGQVGAPPPLPGDRGGIQIGAPAARRAALERQFRQRLARVARERLGLTEAQAERLGPVAQRAETARRALLLREREVRAALRAEVIADTGANQQRIADYLRQLSDIQRQRLATHDREQQELGAFLSPLQRARYLGLLEQMRQAAERLERERAGTGGGRGRRGRAADPRRAGAPLPPSR